MSCSIISLSLKKDTLVWKMGVNILAPLVFKAWKDIINRQANDLDLLKQIKEKAIETNRTFGYLGIWFIPRGLKKKQKKQWLHYCSIYQFNIDNHIAHEKCIFTFPPTQMLALDGSWGAVQFHRRCFRGQFHQQADWSMPAKLNFKKMVFKNILNWTPASL